MTRYAALVPVVAIAATLPLGAQQPRRWKAHDTERPKPQVVTPGAAVGQPPSDAVVLFDGSGLGAWSAEDGRPPGWSVRDGYMETAAGAGAIRTKGGFGDVQLHVEWATPGRAEGRGQGRGNSGVIVMGKYEVQVLDSYRNETYTDGQAASVYGQYPPLVNASRGPGEWQSYDIVFRRPRFAANGVLQAPARMTVFHNGVLVQDNVELWGPTTWLQHERYAPHPDTLPLVLQDHANPVRYRNIWLRRLADVKHPTGLAESRPQVTVPLALLQEYAGTYGPPDARVARVTLRRGQLVLSPLDSERQLALVPITRERFGLQHTAGTVEFTRRPGAPPRIRLQFAEVDREGERQERR
ncbi:MAG: 3-keto-disaccharide hydrolase [Gemmatimonadaceae bacterium]